MCFNVGVIIGPILGGFLADPVHSFPNTFGPDSSIGGKNGVRWMTNFPYALPNLVSGIFILISAFGVILFLDEPHEALRNKPDYGRKLGKFIARHILRSGAQDTYHYTPLHEQSVADSVDLEEHPGSIPVATDPPATPKTEAPSPPTRVPLRAIFTRNVSLTLLCHHLLALHISSFNALIFLLLPANRSENEHSDLPLAFTGGLGLSTEQVGLATAIIGTIGLPLPDCGEITPALAPHPRPRGDGERAIARDEGLGRPPHHRALRILAACQPLLRLHRLRHEHHRVGRRGGAEGCPLPLALRLRGKGALGRLDRHRRRQGERQDHAKPSGSAIPARRCAEISVL